MAKQLNIDLNFRADTTQAMQSLNVLKNDLEALSNSSIKLPFNQQIQQAQEAVAHLKVALSSSVNTKNGVFDLSKFQQSLKNAGLTLGQLRQQMSSLGVDGQKAFLSLSQSIAQAEIPARRTGKLLSELGVTLKNTIKWQFSSSMLHGFIGSIQKAYHYAQNLNASLNDIRIVTGKSAEEMGKFAKEANQAAQALSSTTLAYTKASLIYYQQGLDNTAVKERTEATVKMANVTRESAKTVSDQMTAVWNNFDDGSKSLEYYADVMTALGAATASSTSEIAQGLEKFAAIADTVGLSYEYATSALATVVATTRQSADVVGTAFKTMFARIQSLKLGDTLEDGTDLTKYSSALNAVGVQIKDAQGNLKDMDDILEELGTRWQTLASDEKVALAQTVAGTRQYSQLIALMDNWDFMQKNLGTAKSSEGTLTEQQKVYEESWEGASKRVQASAEEMYSALINDEFFIQLTNGFAKVLDGLKQFIDLIGGARGLLLGVSSIILSMFGDKVAKSIDNIVYSFKTFVGLNQKEAAEFKAESEKESSKVIEDMNKNRPDDADVTDKRMRLSHKPVPKVKKGKNSRAAKAAATAAREENLRRDAINYKNGYKDEYSKNEQKAIEDYLDNEENAKAVEAGAAQTQTIQETNLRDNNGILAAEKSMTAQKALYQDLNENSANLTEEQKNYSQELINQNKALGEQLELTAKLADEAREKVSETGQDAELEMESEGVKKRDETGKLKTTKVSHDQAQRLLLQANDQFDAGDTAVSSVENLIEQLTKGEITAGEFKQKLVDIAESTPEGFDHLKEKISGVAESIDETSNHSEAAKQAIQELNGDVTATLEDAATKDATNAAQGIVGVGDSAKAYVKELGNVHKAQRKVNTSTKNFGKATQATSRSIQGIAKQAKTTSQTMVGFAQSLTSVAFAVNQIVNIGNIISDDNLNAAEKMLKIMTAALPAILMLINGLKNFETTLLSSKTAEDALLLTRRFGKDMTADEIKNATILSGLQGQKIVLDKAEADQLYQTMTAKEFNQKLSEKDNFLTKLNLTDEQKKLVVDGLDHHMTLDRALAHAGLTTAQGGNAISSKILSIANKILAKTNIEVTATSIPLWVIAIALGAAFLALGGIIYGLTAAFKAISNAYNKDAIDAEKAAESARELSKAYEECKQKHDDLITSLEKYNKAQDTLDGLVEGTKEYADALQEANRAAMELINSSDKFTSEDYHWENGRLIIDQAAQDRVEGDLADEERRTFAMSQMANAKAKQAKAKADTTAKARAFSKEKEDGLGSMEGAVVGTTATIIAGAINPVLGALVGIFSAGMNAMGAEQRVKDEAAYKEVAKAVAEDPTIINNDEDTFKEIMQTKFNIKDDDLIKALYDNRDALEDLGHDIQVADEAERMAAENASHEIMADSTLHNTKSGEQALEAGGRVYQALTKEAEDKYNNVQMADFFGVGTEEGKEMFAKYADAAGLSDKNGFKVTNYRKDGGVDYKYIDESGQEQEGHATKEMITSTLAAADAADGLSEALENLQKEILRLNKSTDAGDHAMADFLANGDFSNSTVAELEDIRKDVGGPDENGNYDEGAIKEYLGLTGDDAEEVAKAHGYASADEYVKAFNEALKIDVKEIQGVSEAVTANMTVGAQNAIHNQMKGLNAEGKETYANMLTSFQNQFDQLNLTPEKQEEAWTRLSQIDWTSWDAGEQAAKIMADYGGKLDGQEWYDFAATMRKVTGAVPDLAKMNEEFAKIEKITDKIDIGSILSKEDYEALVKYDAALSKYFTILSDGTAQFTGDKLDFQQEVKRAKIGKLDEAAAGYENNVQVLKEQRAKGLGLIGGDEENIHEYTSSASNGNGTYSGSKIDTQLDFLESQGYDEDQLAEWRKDAEDGTLAVDVEESIAKAVEKTAESFTGLDGEIEKAENAEQQLRNEIALTAEDFDERQELLAKGLINQEAYANAAEAAINAEKWEGIDANEVEEYASYLSETNENLKGNEEAAEDMALAVMKMNKGIEDLSSNWKDWSDVLKHSAKNSQEYAKAIKSLEHAISDITGVSEDFIDLDWLQQTDVMGLIEKAAEGDEHAIDALGKSLAKDIFADALENHADAVDAMLEKQGITLGAFKDEWNNFIDTFDTTQLKPGDMIDDASYIDKLNEIVRQTGMSIEEMNAFYQSLGFTPHFKMVEAKEANSIPITTTYHNREVTGWADDAHTIPSDWVDKEYSTTEQVDGGTLETSFPSLAMGDAEVPSAEIESVTWNGGGAMNNSSSVNKGGGSAGGGKADKKEPTKKEDVVQRYKEIDDVLNDINREMDRANKAADRLYGNARISQMEKANELVKEQMEATKKKREEAERYLAIDRQNLGKAASAAGVTLDINDNGNIDNYTSVMTSLYNKLHAAEVAAGGNPTESEQENIDYINKLIEDLQSAIDQYDETNQLRQDLADEEQEQFYAWQDANADILTAKIELKLDLNEKELDKIQHKLNLLGDDFYKSAEAGALLLSQNTYYNANLDAEREHVEALTEAHNKGEISDAAYAEALDESTDIIYENLEALKELDDTMMDYYGDTLEKGLDEISKYTDKMENCTSVLDHYKNVLGAIGEENNYKAMGTILDGQISVLKDQMTAEEATYNMLASKVEEQRQLRDQALAENKTDAAELFQKQLDEAEAQLTQSQDRMLSKTEAWAEAMKEAVQNQLNSLSFDLEKALTGGSTFDRMNTALKRAQSSQEEFLTTTNKIYETTKLMNKANSQLEKTDSRSAKARLNAFMRETQALQNQGKLSKYELSIQQAKYDLLLAKIALEDAQNAKNTVQLVRNSEGGYGYVYTANEEKTAQAEQNVADKENELYNKGLEGAANYTDKYKSTMSEMYDTLKQLQEDYLSGAFENEDEYNNAVQEALNYYYGLLGDYSNLYNISLDVDNRIRTDSWTTAFSGMMDDANNWQQAVSTYVDNVKNVFSEWDNEVQIIKDKTVGPNLDALQGKVNNITTESTGLVDELTKSDGVIDKVSSTMDKVNDLTSAYAQQRGSLTDLISKYEELIKKLEEYQKELSRTKTAEQNASSHSGTEGGGYAGSAGGNGNGTGGNDHQGPNSSYQGGPTVTLDRTTNDRIRYGYSGRKYIRGSDNLYYLYSKVLEFAKDPERCGGSSQGALVFVQGLRGLNASLMSLTPPENHPQAFDTGGYTGQWGPQGKMALLHEKELVLNKTDTSNLLNAISLLRDTIDNQDLLSRISDSLNSIMDVSTVNKPQQQLENSINQNITIEANFPNVEDYNEIIKAMQELSLNASQYVYRE